jgi:hypothetical protein
MNEKEKPVADWQLERLAQGELGASAARDLDARLGPQLKERLAAIEASNQEILSRLPPETMSAAIRRRLPARKPRGRYLMLLFPLAAAAGIWTVAAPRFASVPSGDEIVTAKGATRLLAYRVQPGATPTRLTPEARVRSHDLVQLAYVAGPARFGMVVSIDGGGGVTQHLPVAGPAPANLAATGEVGLPHSYELDDAPGFERFFFITAPRTFSPAQVLEAARSLARNTDEARRKPLPLDPTLSQESLLLEKVHP